MCEGVKCAGNVTGRAKSLAGHASRCACVAALCAGNVTGCEYAVKLSYAWPESCS